MKLDNVKGHAIIDSIILEKELRADDAVRPVTFFSSMFTNLMKLNCYQSNFFPFCFHIDTIILFVQQNQRTNQTVAGGLFLWKCKPTFGGRRGRSGGVEKQIRTFNARNGIAPKWATHRDIERFFFRCNVLVFTFRFCRTKLFYFDKKNATLFIYPAIKLIKAYSEKTNSLKKNTKRKIRFASQCLNFNFGYNIIHRDEQLFSDFFFHE